MLMVSVMDFQIIFMQPNRLKINFCQFGLQRAIQTITEMFPYNTIQSTNYGYIYWRLIV